MNKVDDKTFDMRTILILISHDHKVTITKSFQVFLFGVLLVVLKTKDLDNVVDFSIVKDLDIGQKRLMVIFPHKV